MKNIKILLAVATLMLWYSPVIDAQDKKMYTGIDSLYKGMQWRNIGPYRGGRSVASSGVIGDPMTYYMGTCGGGVWKTEDAGVSWKNISDGYFNTGSVGAIAVAPSDKNVIYVGMGEHAIRGVMTSHGDGVYKSMDAGKTWQHLGLKDSRHISAIEVHPDNPDVVYVAVQGAAFGATEERGVYKSEDGGNSWRKVLYVDENSGAADLSMDAGNPRVLYATMWDHRRYPWLVKSGGPGSGVYKSTDAGETWKKLTKGLPAEMGKAAVDVSPANPDVLYANIEAEGEKGGVYRSDDAGNSWKQTSKDRVTIARAWYYIEVFADPVDENTVYVLNAPMLKSVDGGKTFESIPNPHGDQHHMWINPDNPENIILSNDGGACVTFNGGKTWSSQENQPTAQFYRVITDSRFPYHIYGGQQDNSTVCIASRANGGISWKDWYAVSGCESAFLAFDPDDPRMVYGGCYQGYISVYDHKTDESKDIMAYPIIGLGWTPKEMKYRFNWNAPIVASSQDFNTIYHAGNKVLKTRDGGLSWQEISPDLTQNDMEKQIDGGGPYTNEGAGGEVYGTISYLECSPHDAGVIWSGSDDGLVYITRDGGGEWENVTPKGIGEALINSIDVSPHDPATAYVVATRYKFNDFTPMIFLTSNYGKSWTKITNGIGPEDFVRVVREDLKQPGLLYAGTEAGLYISFNNGGEWHKFQLNLPTCPITDLTFQDNDLIVATMGRAFWVLDDLGPLQQSAGELGEDLQVFDPRTAYRVMFGSGRRGLAGKNPPAGVIVDYYLPEGLDSTELSLSIKDDQGNVIRSFSSEKDKDYVKYDGGPAPEKTLDKKHGVNRFVWDMRGKSVPGIEKVFIYGGYSGGLVAPGTYTLEFKQGDQVLTTTCEIKPDPRIDAAPEDYAAQQEMLQKLSNKAIEVHESVNEMREYKKQLEALLAPLEEKVQAAEVVEKGEGIIEKIDTWEDGLIQKKQKTFQDVINFPNRLSSEILNLINRIDGHYPKLTEGAKTRFEDLRQQWEKHKNEMDQLIEVEMKEFNELYKEKNIPALILTGTSKS